MWYYVASGINFIDLFILDGAGYDPTYKLFSAGYSGIAVEGDTRYFKRLSANMRAVNTSGAIQTILEYADPVTLESRLRALGCPDSPDIMKLDIDSSDFIILNAVLSGKIIPKVIMVEVNTDYPPPIDWHMERINQHHVSWSGYFGMSASRAFNYLVSQGYTLVAIEFGSPRDRRCIECEHNMWFVRTDLYTRRAGAGSAQSPTYRDFLHAYWKQFHSYSTYLYTKRNKNAANSFPRCTHVPEQLCLYNIFSK